MTNPLIEEKEIQLARAMSDKVVYSDRASIPPSYFDQNLEQFVLFWSKTGRVDFLRSPFQKQISRDCSI